MSDVDGSRENIFPAGSYLFKVNNRNIICMCEICSKLTIQTLERSQQTEQISHIALIFPLLTLNKSGFVPGSTTVNLTKVILMH